jgi:Domain of unknown function (DUF6946)
MTLSMTLHGRQVASFDELVNGFESDALASPRRSTVPLLDYWREPQMRLNGLWQHVKCDPPDHAELHFEYEVPVQMGRGKASYTDLMILANDIAVAIEAKFTEPRYESVRVWLGQAPTDNRRHVLNGWLRAIAAIGGSTVMADSISEVPYQIVHRTASVCCVAPVRRFVVYQVFGAMPAAHYSEDLGRFAASIAAGKRINFGVLECGFDAGDTYRMLEARWDADKQDISKEVRRALLQGSLMEFREPRMAKIQEVG